MKSVDCSTGLHDYCSRCNCSCHKIKINEFFIWLEQNTDYGSWDESVKKEVQLKLDEALE